MAEVGSGAHGIIWRVDYVAWGGVRLSCGNKETGNTAELCSLLCNLQVDPAAYFLIPSSFLAMIAR